MEPLLYGAPHCTAFTFEATPASVPEGKSPKIAGRPTTG